MRHVSSLVDSLSLYEQIFLLLTRIKISIYYKNRKNSSMQPESKHNAFVYAGDNGFADGLVGMLVADQAAMNKVDIGRC